MNNKRTGFWIWTGVCLIVKVIWILLANTDTKYVGTELSFKLDDIHQFSIYPEYVTLEATSKYPYTLLGPDGQQIKSIPAQIPLGKEGEQSYITKPSQVKYGFWSVEEGANITIHITSPHNTMVQVYRKSFVTSRISLAITLSWAMGVLIGSVITRGWGRRGFKG